MAKIGIFIAFKTERRYSDLLYALNLLSFLLGVIRDSLSLTKFFTRSRAAVPRSSSTALSFSSKLPTTPSYWIYSRAIVSKSNSMKNNSRLFLESASVLVITYSNKANSKMQSLGLNLPIHWVSSFFLSKKKIN